MRVIAGYAKGRRLKMPRSADIRPTLDKVKEALFDILGEEVAEKKVLDLYAGSGSLGIEAISRGAKAAIFIDYNPESIKVVKDNLESLNFQNKAKVLRLDFSRALGYLASQGKRFDLVFLDPPYGKARKSLHLVGKSDILSAHCMVAVEHYKKEVLPEEAGTLARIKSARYGDTCLSFYRKG